MSIIIKSVAYLESRRVNLINIITTRILRFIDVIFCWYLYSQFIGMNFIDGLADKNNPFKKLSLVIYGLSVIILPMNLLTAKAL
jgi:hypothetical protein